MVRETQQGTPFKQQPVPSHKRHAANSAKSSKVARQTNPSRNALDEAAQANHNNQREPLDQEPVARRRPAPSQFDLVVTFAGDQTARDALLALRRERFGPDQAVLLLRGPLNYDEFELALEALRTESYVALGIVVATELAIGALLGGVIGWLAGLFHFGPAVGPVWQPILMVGGIGLLSAGVVAWLDVRRWRKVHLPAPGEAAVALRLRGPDAAARLERAQRVLERFGGQRETG